MFPKIEDLTVWNDVKVGGGGDEAYIYGAPDNYYRYVTGTIPVNRKAYTVDGSMPDPPLFLALELKKALINNGVKVDQQATTVYAMKREKLVVNNERKNLYTHTSAPLSDVVYHTNQKSNNLYAETILKTIGKKKQMCSILNMEMKEPTFEQFKKSLPIAGKSGTLTTVADNTVAAGKVFAKSGSMYKVRSYSGYVQTKSGELLSFCVIVNNYTCGSVEIKTKLEKNNGINGRLIIFVYLSKIDH
ncbi:MAG: D-alanyl-D-alanine carboxypeptidase [Bacteroidetes bacterium]|nr:D-alanyl-D-alanine carboxypeptidase [Bacteroidota bacterium]